MAKYIELEAAIQAAKEPTIYDLTDVPEWLSYLPAADVAPVVHGRWMDAREYCGDFMCSNCDALYGTNKFNYCPNCGARMDGDSNG